jgi:hypothetical protein
VTTPLLENADLTEGERRGYVYTRQALKRGLMAVYEKAGRSMPRDLQNELEGYKGE